MSAIRDDGGGRPASAGDGHPAGDEGPPGAVAARVRLAALRRDAAAVYETIMAADDELRVLADLRVAAERALLVAGQRRDTAENVLNEHLRANSGLRARLWARREQRASRAALAAALDDCAHSLAAARLAYARAQAGLAATVAARADAAARLRGLTEECAAAQQAAACGDSGASGSAP